MSHDSDKETGRDFLIYITIIKQMCQNITSCSCTFPVGVNIVVRVCLLNHARLFATLDCSPAGSSVYGIAQARILEWVAISSSRGTSLPRVRTWVSCMHLVRWQVGSLPLSRQGSPEGGNPEGGWHKTELAGALVGCTCPI